MMDGQVMAIRDALDEAGRTEVAILAYAAKYASALYGPFREAVDVEIAGGGDRRAYQQDMGNAREAMEEIRADIAEGADMVMVKPALAYLDILARARAEVDVPLAAYHVSGEYSMIKAAAERGWIDGDAVALEHLTAIKRAGADMILTYLARESWPTDGGLAERYDLRRHAAHRQRRLFARAQARHPRRRQLAGAGLPLGRGHALLRGPGRGRLRLGRRGPPATSTWSSPTGRSSSATPTRRSSTPSSEAAAEGTSYGAPTEREVLLAEEHRGPGCPACERVRLVSSGTEATMTALRLARGATGRDRIVKFAGNYHGHSDGLLADAGSAVALIEAGAGDARPCPARPACPPGPWPTPWWPRTTSCPSSTTTSPASSSSPSPPTWAWSRRRRASWPGCGPSATGSAPC